MAFAVQRISVNSGSPAGRPKRFSDRDDCLHWVRSILVFLEIGIAISVGVTLLLIKSVFSGEREKDEPSSFAPQS